MAKFRDTGRGEVRDVALSFETGEQGSVKLYFPEPVVVTKLRSTVLKALAATDAGTITGANATGASSSGVLTHPLSAAIGNEQNTVPTSNNYVTAGSFYQLTTAKTTAGGKVIVSVEYVTSVS